MSNKNELLERALKLSPEDKAILIEQLRDSLEKPDKELDEIWQIESENRIDKFDKGLSKAFSVDEVLAKYRKKHR